MQIKTSVLQDETLRQQTEFAIESNQIHFFGELDFYALYLNEQQEKYALIYGFYHESKYSICEISSFIEKDLVYLLSLLKQKRINLDYFFLMPYYEMDVSRKTSLLLPPSTTKDIEIKL